MCFYVYKRKAPSTYGRSFYFLHIKTYLSYASVWSFAFGFEVSFCIVTAVGAIGQIQQAINFNFSSYVKCHQQRTMRRNICFQFFEIYKDAVFLYISKPSFLLGQGRNREPVVYDYVINIDDNFFLSVFTVKERPCFQSCHHQMSSTGTMVYLLLQREFH